MIINPRKQIKSKFSSNLGKLIKEHRLLLGISQEKLAEIVGCSRSNISHYESGKYLPDVYDCNLILRELKFDLKFE